MENTLAVAKTMFVMYDEMFQKKMDEMKMHKLMYFTQRESLIINNDILFSEYFCGWKYGPVLLSVRNEFHTGRLFSNVNESVSEETKALIRSVLERFGKISSWNLSTLSHEELSWKLSRKGLDSSDNGTTILSISAMRLDAAREAASRESKSVTFS